MLRSFGDISSFWYLNEIGVQNEHFNFATLSDKQIVSFYYAKSSILLKNI
jgi:hypothetical protein